MASKYFTAKEIIALHEKYNSNGEYGNLFDIDLSKVGQSKSSKLKCYYIPLLIKNFDGSKTKLRFKFTNQLLASNAKLSPYAEENKSKDVTIMFRTMNNDDLEKSNYMNDITKMHDILLTSNKEFIKVNDIINNEYRALAQNKIINHKGKEFTIKNKKISSFKQDYRNLMEVEKNKSDDEIGFSTFENEKGERCVSLENPLYRYRLPVEQEEPYRIGNCRTEGKSDEEKTKKKFEYAVFDCEKTKRTSSGWYTPPAKILKNDKQTDLDINTVGLFVSYLSLITGNASFDSITLSSQGISLKPKINEIYVVHHKRQKKDYMEDDDYNSMALVMNSMKKTDNDNDLVVDDNEEKLNKLSLNSNKEDNNEVIDEPEEHNNTVSQEKKEPQTENINEAIEQKLSKTIITRKTNKSKSTHKKQVSDDDDA
jgi:hypothetical protein